MPKKKSKKKKQHRHDPFSHGVLIQCWDPRCGADPGQLIFTRPPMDLWAATP